uniref:Kinesin light chain n=1 Tax=Chaetoceros debilis TaxID=122233 RepID=A0A6S8WNC7_9STRA
MSKHYLPSGISTRPPRHHRRKRNEKKLKFNDTESMKALREESVIQSGLSFISSFHSHSAKRGKTFDTIADRSHKEHLDMPATSNGDVNAFLGVRPCIDDDSDVIRIQELSSPISERRIKGMNGAGMRDYTNPTRQGCLRSEGGDSCYHLDDEAFIRLGPRGIRSSISRRFGRRRSRSLSKSNAMLDTHFVPSDASTIMIPPIVAQRKTKRKLHWRVGSLVKKPKQKKATKYRDCVQHGSSELSYAEKTVKSFHTFHSTETMKMENNGPNHHRSFLGSTRKGHLLRDASADLKSPTGTESTVSSLDSDDEIDNIEALNLEQLEESLPQRTIGLFLFNNSSSIEHVGIAKHRKIGKGSLPPLGVTAKNRVNVKAAELPSNSRASTLSGSISEDDDGASGGVLWELAKEIAISEGRSPIKTKDKENIRKLSFQQSIISSEDSSVQIIQSERNLRAIHRLALQHLHFREWDEAIYVLEEMLRGVQEVYGPGHHRVGTVLHNLASTFMRAKRFDKAIQASRKAIDIRRSALGPSHADVAVSHSLMGLAHMETEQHDLAMCSLQRALAIRRKLIPRNDKKIVRLLNNIGCSQFDLGKLQDAASAFEEALQVQRSIMKMSKKTGIGEETEGSIGVNHCLLGIASTLCNLGSIKLRWKQHNGALAYLEEALLIQQSVYGEVHSLVENTKDTIDFIVAQSKQNPKKSSGRAVDNIICRMQGVGFEENSSNSMRMYNPLKALTDVMSLKKAEWVQIFEEFGGSPKLCMNCLSVADEMSISDRYFEGEGEDHAGRDLHWI